MSLSRKCSTYKNFIDIDGLDLFSELKVIREVIQTEENKNTTVDILNYVSLKVLIPINWLINPRIFM